MTRRAHAGLLIAVTAAGLTGLGLHADAASRVAPAKSQGKAASHVPTPKPRPTAAASSTGSIPAAAARPGNAKSAGVKPAFAVTSTTSTSALDLAAVKEAIGLARSGKSARATDVESSISDPLARKLVEWAVLRNDDNDASFRRYAAFISANPTWPSMGLLRRRAESMLWQEHADLGTIRGFLGQSRPATSKGHFALARALLAQGDRANAQAVLREAWRNDNFSGDLENTILDNFRDLITAADLKARMDMRLYAEDTEGGLRNANRIGGEAPAIAKARIAVIKKAANAKALIDALPADVQRHDIGVIFSHAQLLRRADKAAEAAALILALPNDPTQAIDTDQWWIERRLIARKLLDLGDAKSAYKIARDAVPPAKENYNIEHEFTAGWIALRFLNDPTTALGHFNRILESGTSNPISLSRAGYWQGRAYEALGRTDEARRHYEAAARYGTAYYGQLARARVGLKDIPLHAPPERPGAANLEVVRAADILYAIGEREMVVGALADLGERSGDASALAALGEVAIRHKDARTTLLIGKGSLGRGLPLEQHAFPTIGIPEYRPIAPPVEPCVVYAIARQESLFWQGTVSSAKAMGLMQVTPEAGRETAKKFNATYDGKRLLSDPVYNVQMGAAELADLMGGYRGSYILTFAGYNAGRGRVREWINRYGDPRDPDVDPIDWVERIPFSETRNYVQRVMENMQVYRVRFGGGSKLLIEADIHRGATAN